MHVFMCSGECNNSGLGIKESRWVWSKMAVTLHPLGVEVIGGKAYALAMHERTRRGQTKRERDSSPAPAPEGGGIHAFLVSNS